MTKAEERAHYRITIDVIAEPDGVNRCSDIEHHLYMSKNQLVPYTVGAEDVKYKVEFLGYLAEGQTKKYLIEWVEEQLAILDEQTQLHPDDDVSWGRRNAYEQMKYKLNYSL